VVWCKAWWAQAETQSSNLRKCLAEARRLNKPYAIESATYLIQVEKDFINKQDVLRHSRRIFYTLRALQPIKSDQDLFIEEIDTHIPNAVFEHWYGNEKEFFMIQTIDRNLMYSSTWKRTTSAR
jgi:hypothetical protein